MFNQYIDELSKNAIEAEELRQAIRSARWHLECEKAMEIKERNAQAQKVREIIVSIRVHFGYAK